MTSTRPNTFVSNWRRTNEFDNGNVTLGGLNTYGWGDFNMDGKVNFSDWSILRDAHQIDNLVDRNHRIIDRAHAFFQNQAAAQLRADPHVACVIAEACLVVHLDFVDHFRYPRHLPGQCHRLHLRVGLVDVAGKQHAAFHHLHADIDQQVVKPVAGKHGADFV